MQQYISQKSSHLQLMQLFEDGCRFLDILGSSTGLKCSSPFGTIEIFHIQFQVKCPILELHQLLALLAWKCLYLTLGKNTTFNVIFSDMADITKTMSSTSITYCPGLLGILQSSKPMQQYIGHTIISLAVDATVLRWMPFFDIFGSSTGLKYSSPFGTFHIFHIQIQSKCPFHSGTFHTFHMKNANIALSSVKQSILRSWFRTLPGSQKELGTTEEVPKQISRSSGGSHDG